VEFAVLLLQSIGDFTGDERRRRENEFQRVYLPQLGFDGFKDVDRKARRGDLHFGPRLDGLFEVIARKAIVKPVFTSGGIDQQSLTVTWGVIYLAANIGVLGGGWLSCLFSARDIAPARIRLWIMLACAALFRLAASIPHLGSVSLVLAVGRLALFAHLAWLVNLSSLVIDLLPRALLGFIFALVAAGSTLRGLMMMNRAVGAPVTNASYDPALEFMLLLHPLALMLLRFGGVPRPVAARG